MIQNLRKVLIKFCKMINTCIICAKTLFWNSYKNFLTIIAKFYLDKNYYLIHYPEIKKKNIDPFEHYMTQGWKENKNPSNDFNTRFYKLANPNFDENALNPLQHYVQSKMLFQNVFSNYSHALKATPLNNPKYYLTIVALFRDEAKYLKEWIEFHKIQGVEHFYLYNHLSKDDYMSILKPYIDEGSVELNHITNDPKNLAEWNQLQTQIYLEAVQNVKDDVEWLIILDTDEFLFPLEEKSLNEILRNYDEYPALSVNWKIFGSGKTKKIKDQKLLIETLLFSKKKRDLHVKSIVKPRYVENFINPHFPILKPGYFQVTENFSLFKGAFSETPQTNILRINHYWARDWNFFDSTKLSRVHIMDKNISATKKHLRIKKLIQINCDASISYDTTILKFVPKLRIRLGYDMNTSEEGIINPSLTRNERS